GISTLDSDTRERVVNVEKLRALLQKKIKSHAQSSPIIIEGHLLCEIALPLTCLLVLTCDPEVLEKRLRKRGYSDVKIFDNVFCEDTGYCLSRAQKNYSASTINVVPTHRPKKVIREELLNTLAVYSSLGGKHESHSRRTRRTTSTHQRPRARHH
ncbi:MAG: AAA family ATPase, partial [archaeon]